jgi:hypothetical protein
MMNDPSSGTPAADQYAQEEQPGGFCIKIYVGVDGQVQSIRTETEMDESGEGAEQKGGQPMSTDQALQQVRQMIEQGQDSAAPQRTADEEAMDGYRGAGRRNVVGVNDVFSRS